MTHNTHSEIMEKLDYLWELARRYPNVQSASTEIINLQAILNLPKGTEHFMSDLHGEYEAFEHILNNASGVIKEKVDSLYSNTLPARERAVLSTLIYYPSEKLDETKRRLGAEELGEWYKITLNRLTEICRLVSSKYTRSKVRKSLPPDFEYIIDELIHVSVDERNKESYYANIIDTIIDLDRADAFIIAICGTIKRLVVDRLHIVGDIFDRGPRPDIIMDSLISHHSVDIQWGNHDVLWLGAAAGSLACIANVLNNSITYQNLDVIETGYGISLRPLALFAGEVYANSSVACFQPKTLDEARYSPKDLALTARMHKALAIILLKLEGQLILRNPAFQMEDRLLLDKINYEKGTVCLNGRDYPLCDFDFPTVSEADPFALRADEAALMERLRFSFVHSEKLQRHVRFLYAQGGLYLCYNQNLLFHGCVPMEEDGEFLKFSCGEEKLCGRQYMDYLEAVARQGYYGRPGSPQRQFGQDCLWFLWCGKNSPLFGRERMCTFERLLIEDKGTWEEPKNAYYRHIESEETCVRLLAEFGITGEHAHIVNGHVPVLSREGESPIKAGGRLIVIDGGFCRAYQPKTGIAGYTLIYNSYGIRISAHEPFGSARAAIENNSDILSSSTVFETVLDRIKVGGTDIGRGLISEISGLRLLLSAYHEGVIKEDSKH